MWQVTPAVIAISSVHTRRLQLLGLVPFSKTGVRVTAARLESVVCGQLFSHVGESMISSAVRVEY